MAHTPERLNVLLVDDHPPVRRGVRIGLEVGPAAYVVSEVGSAEDALASIDAHAPDVAVVDYELPGIDGVELVEVLRRRGCDTPVVVLSAHREHAVVERSFAAGANAFVAKESEIDVLVAALDAVRGGRRFVDPALAEMLLGPREDRLSAREAQILTLMCDGLPNKAIAGELMVSQETVKSHVSAVMRKLGATSRTHAVGIAFRGGVVT